MIPYLENSMEGSQVAVDKRMEVADGYFAPARLQGLAKVVLCNNTGNVFYWNQER